MSLFTPMEFWFTKDQPLFIPFTCVLLELNKQLEEENPDMYKLGYRYIDVYAYGFRSSNRIQLFRLDENGKILLEFRPANELIFTANCSNLDKSNY